MLIAFFFVGFLSMSENERFNSSCLMEHLAHTINMPSFFIQILDLWCNSAVRYLSTLENHTPKASYWGGRAKPLKYHIGHPILTNVGQRHPILPWLLTSSQFGYFIYCLFAISTSCLCKLWLFEIKADWYAKKSCY